MLMEVKNQFRVLLYSIKYALQREMLNKFTFISNVVFMILNNACFIIQWLVLFSVKDSIGGYSMNTVILLWGIAASTFGFSHFFFKDAYSLPDIINTGKLDNYLIQPKNVLLSCITGSVSVSSIGDLLYGLIMLCIYGFSLKNLLLFLFFTISGGLMLAAITIIYASFSFWFGKVDIITGTINSFMTTFATYPEGIFKGFIKILFYTIIPLEFVNYIPLKLFAEFNVYSFLAIICVLCILIFLAVFVFYQGLKRYSSSNLMNVRV